jgi:hypothetical protein
LSRGDATPTQARVFLIETSAADKGKHLAVAIADRRD